GGNLPPQFTRPEVAEILRTHYRSAAATPSSGFILWFTGLSGAGKSTLAHQVKPVLEQKFHVEILDGDEVRTFLSKGLGFSKEDCDANIRRIGYVARLLARHGVAVLTAAISPYAAIRNEVRAAAVKEGIPFIEVFVQTELAGLAQRDVKGLYKKALGGELPHFTGVSDPYEPPTHPDVTVRSDQETVEENAARILEAVWARLAHGTCGAPACAAPPPERPIA